MAFTLNAGLALFVRRPEPAFHDEFSYLLAADTFASGRLTNPTHPMWAHFESFHIIHQPTYQSKYPPAQGLILAAGQRIGGHPMVGLWIAMALACSATCWMFQGWMPRRWAFLGGVLVMVHPKIVAWWGQTYWGGAVAMLGGALVYGALPRLMRRPSPTHALLMGVGLPVLMNSRPFEGAVASLPAVGLLLWRASRWPMGLWGRRVVLPVLAVLMVTGVWTAYYNYRVTGRPLRLPYQVWLETYTGRDAVYRNPELERYEGSYEPSVGEKLQRLGSFYLPHVLGLTLVALPWTWKSTGTRIALLACGLETVASVAASRAWPHYAAPVAGLVFLLVTQGLRALWLKGQRTRRVLVAAAWTLFVAHLCSLPLLYVRREPAVWFQNWQYARSGMIELLEKDANEHLVLVRYSPNHDVHREWVYNRADIAGSRVVWARELSPELDRRLLDFFRNRRIWLLVADAVPPRLQPYTPR